MNLRKLMFRLSLIANIVLVVWALSQRARIRNMLRLDDEANAVVDEAIRGLRDIKQKVRDTDLRMTARGDQLDAFLEERGIYGDYRG